MAASIYGIDKILRLNNHGLDAFAFLKRDKSFSIS
jgi:hypothetical protein